MFLHFVFNHKKGLKHNLNRNIKGLDEFKLAMQIITTIQSTNISTELQLHEIQETFAILADHKIEVMNYIYAHTHRHILLSISSYAHFPCTDIHRT